MRDAVVVSLPRGTIVRRGRKRLDLGWKPVTTLYEWAGGEPAIRRLMDTFYDRVEGDELLSPFFPGGVSEEHRAHVAAWWCEVFG